MLLRNFTISGVSEGFLVTERQETVVLNDMVQEVVV